MTSAEAFAELCADVSDADVDEMLDVAATEIRLYEAQRARAARALMEANDQLRASSEKLAELRATLDALDAVKRRRAARRE